MRSLAAPLLKPEVAPLPHDEGLPGLRQLFEGEWVWEAFCSHFGLPEEVPERLRLTQLLYWPGTQAVASYVAERQWERWVVEDQFAIELVAGEPERLFRYPDDPYLPGLPRVASALEAQQLLPKYVRLHPRRLQERGYNQSSLLAQELGRLIGSPVVTGSLLRQRDTPAQAKAIAAEARRSNVADAFACRDGRLRAGEVLLIDDVCTTGATLNSCAHALKAAGATSVWGLTVAREV